MRRATVMLGALTVLATGCGGGSDTGQGPGPGTPVLTKAPSQSGDGQAGIVGQALPAPMRVVVMLDGAPQAGAAIAWGAGAGSVSPATSVTDASGIGSTVWTLGTVAGTQNAHAALAGATGSPVAFTATAAPDAASAIAIFGGNGQVGTTGSVLATPLQVRAADQFGNPVAGVTIAWAAASGGGSVAPATAVTNSQGIAAATQTLPAAEGAATVTATAVGLSGSPQTFSNTAVPPGSASGVQVINNQFVPATLTVSAGTTVIWTWGTGSVGHTIVPQPDPGIPSDPALHDAPHTYSVTFTTPGTYRYYCVQHGAAGTNGIPTGMAGAIIVQ